MTAFLFFDTPGERPFYLVVFGRKTSRTPISCANFSQMDCCYQKEIEEAMESSRLKANKKFRPCEVDDNDELYPNGIFVFNITKLLVHLKTNPDCFLVEDVAVATLGITSSNLDETTVQGANLQAPILLAEIAPGKFNVVDGNHRVEKARRDGVNNLPAYRVGPAVHYRFLTSAAAYKSYVEYWNEKVAENVKRLKKRI